MSQWQVNRWFTESHLNLKAGRKALCERKAGSCKIPATGPASPAPTIASCIPGRGKDKGDIPKTRHTKHSKGKWTTMKDLRRKGMASWIAFMSLQWRVSIHGCLMFRLHTFFGTDTCTWPIPVWFSLSLESILVLQQYKLSPLTRYWFPQLERDKCPCEFYIFHCHRYSIHPWLA